MALIYSYLFPTIFLLAFWVLYRYEQSPLVPAHRRAADGDSARRRLLRPADDDGQRARARRVAAVSSHAGLDRSARGQHARRRATSCCSSPELVQLVLAMALGMPLPRHPFELWLAFTCVSFAFIGLGLVIAMMADNVPAVQALGQCIFLPMLIIGGVAVPLASLPDWAQHVSSFFPGRYAVESLNAAVMGDGLAPARFSILALLLIGAAGCLAGARLFRWDAEQRFATVPGKGWVAVALAAWVAVGVAAENRHHAVTRTTSASNPPRLPAPAPAAASTTPPAIPAPEPPAPPASTILKSQQMRPVPPLPTPARHTRSTVDGAASDGGRTERTAGSGDATGRRAEAPCDATGVDDHDPRRHRP